MAGRSTLGARAGRHLRAAFDGQDLTFSLESVRQKAEGVGPPQTCVSSSTGILSHELSSSGALMKNSWSASHRGKPLATAGIILSQGDGR